MSLSSTSITFKGKRYYLKDEQMNAPFIGKLCHLFPDSILLIADNGAVESANKDGILKLEPFTEYEVQGQAIMDRLDDAGELVATVTSSPGPRMASSHLPVSSKKAPFTFRGPKGKGGSKAFVCKGYKSESAITWRKNVEICKFLEGTGLKKISNHPVTITAESANISSISQIISFEAFKGQQVVLLDKDNLRIPDNSTTKDTSYWKSGIHVKAVSIYDYTTMVGEDENSDNEVSEDDIHVGMDKKRMKYHDVEERLVALERKMNSGSVDTLLQESVINIFKENLECIICKQILSKNLYILSCCKTLGCCKNCLDEWIKEDNRCPHCRETVSETGKVQVVCHQITNILEAIKSITD